MAFSSSWYRGDVGLSERAERDEDMEAAEAAYERDEAERVDEDATGAEAALRRDESEALVRSCFDEFFGGVVVEDIP